MISIEGVEPRPLFKASFLRRLRFRFGNTDRKDAYQLIILRNIEDLCQSLGKESLTGAGGADEQNIALLQFHI